MKLIASDWASLTETFPFLDGRVLPIELEPEEESALLLSNAAKYTVDLSHFEIRDRLILGWQEQEGLLHLIKKALYAFHDRKESFVTEIPFFDTQCRLVFEQVLVWTPGKLAAMAFQQNEIHCTSTQDGWGIYPNTLFKRVWL